MPRSLRRLAHDLEEIAGNAIAAGILSAIGLIILSRILNSPVVRGLDAVPIAGGVVQGSRAAVGSIVTP